MFHFYYVGHIDPRDSVDYSVRPCKPKLTRPLSRDAVKRVLIGFLPDVARYVDYDHEGFVVCRWSHAPMSLWDSIHRFALALAESERAVLMNEAPQFEIEFPQDIVDGNAR